MGRRIGFIDLDRKNIKNNFPNLPIMKLSAYHKAQGDAVEWYEPLNGHFDKVYISKVFSFTPKYQFYIDADEVEEGGSGFAIRTENGREIYDKTKDRPLPYEIEHIYPDYSLYGITDTAYGFLTRGCPRGCDFCHVKAMQGSASRKVANLDEFWNGQKNIILLDANITACKEWRELWQQLIDSRARVDFSQGLDVRLMDEEKAEILKNIKNNGIHFAWDRYEDKKIILPKLRMVADVTGWNRKKIIVYVLIGNKERRVTAEDLERVEILKEFCYPYIMIYNKEELPKHHELKAFQRWVNNRFIFESVPTFEEYQRGNKENKYQIKLF